MYPCNFSHPDPCSQLLFPFSIIDTENNKNTPLLVSNTPPHLQKFVIPLSNKRVLKEYDDGSKINLTFT